MIIIYADGILEPRSPMEVFHCDGHTHVCDWSEYGVFCNCQLRQRGAVHAGTMTLSEFLSGRTGQIEIRGCGRTRDGAIGGDFSLARRKATWKEPVDTRTLLKHVVEVTDGVSTPIR